MSDGKGALAGGGEAELRRRPVGTPPRLLGRSPSKTLMPRTGAPLRRSPSSVVCFSPMALEAEMSEAMSSLQPRAPTLTRRHSVPVNIASWAHTELNRIGRSRTVGTMLVRMGAIDEVAPESEARGEMAADTAARPPARVVGCFLLVLASGVGTNVAFELLARDEPGCASLLSLLQYTFALCGTLPVASTHVRSSKIPLRLHVAFTALMLATSLLGNASVDYKLPFPLYLIIKSSNLVANLLVGSLLFRKTYARAQWLAVLAMTAGVVLSTLVSRRADADTDAAGSAASMAVGAALCVLSTLCMSVLGCLQEVTFARYGQHHDEALFYIHALGLIPLLYLSGAPALALLRGWLALPSSVALSSAPARRWLLLLANLVACHACKRSFFALLGATSALSATLAVLGYRFVGICLSAFVFNAPPSPPPSMSIGIGLVTGGGLAYLAASQSPPEVDRRDDDSDDDILRVAVKKRE